jgi:hypothetical protein
VQRRALTEPLGEIAERFLGTLDLATLGLKDRSLSLASSPVAPISTL